MNTSRLCVCVRCTPTLCVRVYVCLYIGVCGKVQESTFSGAAVVRAEPFRAAPVGGEWSARWRGHTDRAGVCVTCTACAGVVAVQETENTLRRMQIRMREDEKRMMEDDVIPIPDLMMGEEDLRGKGGKLGLLGWDMDA